jgi:hypothetical protein
MRRVRAPAVVFVILVALAALPVLWLVLAVLINQTTH